MASCPPTSEEYAAIRLLVATWDAIAARVRAGDIPVDPFFETNPVSHMWEALVSAINIIKGTTPGYADNFRWLYKRYKKWLDQSDKSRRYRTAARVGMNSGFG